jgi:hypothetical protein
MTPWLSSPWASPTPTISSRRSLTATADRYRVRCPRRVGRPADRRPTSTRAPSRLGSRPDLARRTGGAVAVEVDPDHQADPRKISVTDVPGSPIDIAGSSATISLDYGGSGGEIGPSLPGRTAGVRVRGTVGWGASASLQLEDGSRQQMCGIRPTRSRPFASAGNCGKAAFRHGDSGPGTNQLAGAGARSPGDPVTR